MLYGPTSVNTDTEYTHNNLNDNTTYIFKVTKITSSSTEFISDPFSVITESIVNPTAPTFITPSTVNFNSITIEWNENSNGSGILVSYNVSVYNNSGGLIQSNINTNTNRYYTAISLDENTEYKFKVTKITRLTEITSSDINTESIFSTPIRSHYKASSPPVISIGSKTETSIDISWTHGTDHSANANFAYYRVSYKKRIVSSFTNLSDISDINTKNKTITSLTRSTQYDIKVSKFITYPGSADEFEFHSVSFGSTLGDYPPQGDLHINEVTWNGTDTFTIKYSKSHWVHGVPRENYYLYFQNTQIKDLGDSVQAAISTTTYNAGTLTSGNYEFIFKSLNVTIEDFPISSLGYTITLSNPNLSNHNLTLQSISNNSTININRNTNIGGDFNYRVTSSETLENSVLTASNFKTSFSSFTSADIITYKSTLLIDNGTSHTTQLVIYISNYFGPPSGIASVTNINYTSASSTLSFTITNISPETDGNKNGSTIDASYQTKITANIKNSSGGIIETISNISSSSGNKTGLPLTQTAVYNATGTFTVEVFRTNHIYNSTSTFNTFTVYNVESLTITNDFYILFKNDNTLISSSDNLSNFHMLLSTYTSFQTRISKAVGYLSDSIVTASAHWRFFEFKIDTGNNNLLKSYKYTYHGGNANDWISIKPSVSFENISSHTQYGVYKIKDGSSYARIDFSQSADASNNVLIFDRTSTNAQQFIITHLYQDYLPSSSSLTTIPQSSIPNGPTSGNISDIFHYPT